MLFVVVDDDDGDFDDADVGLLSERQCVARNARRQETHKVKRRQHRLSVVSAEGRKVTDDTGAGVAGSQSPPLCHSPLQLLSDEHSNLIALLVAYQDKYDLPTEDDIRKVSVCLSYHLCLCLSVLHVCRLYVSVCVCMCVCTSVCMSACMSSVLAVCTSVCLSVLHVCLSLYLSELWVPVCLCLSVVCPGCLCPVSVCLSVLHVCFSSVSV